MKTADEARANGYEVVTVTNDSDETLQVIVEPWATGTALLPRQSCELWLKHDANYPPTVGYSRSATHPYITFEAVSHAIWEDGKMVVNLL